MLKANNKLINGGHVLDKDKPIEFFLDSSSVIIHIGHCLNCGPQKLAHFVEAENRALSDKSWENPPAIYENRKFIKSKTLWINKYKLHTVVKNSRELKKGEFGYSEGTPENPAMGDSRRFKFNPKFLFDIKKTPPNSSPINLPNQTPENLFEKSEENQEGHGWKSEKTPKNFGEWKKSTPKSPKKQKKSSKGLLKRSKEAKCILMPLKIKKGERKLEKIEDTTQSNSRKPSKEKKRAEQKKQKNQQGTRNTKSKVEMILENLVELNLIKLRLSNPERNSSARKSGHFPIFFDIDSHNSKNPFLEKIDLMTRKRLKETFKNVPLLIGFGDSGFAIDEYPKNINF